MFRILHLTFVHLLQKLDNDSSETHKVIDLENEP